MLIWRVLALIAAYGFSVYAIQNDTSVHATSTESPSRKEPLTSSSANPSITKSTVFDSQGSFQPILQPSILKGLEDHIKRVTETKSPSTQAQKKTTPYEDIDSVDGISFNPSPNERPFDSFQEEPKSAPVSFQEEPSKSAPISFHHDTKSLKDFAISEEPEQIYEKYLKAVKQKEFQIKLQEEHQPSGDRYEVHEHEEYKPLKFDNESPSVPKETSAQHPYPYHHFTEGPAKGGDEASFILGGSSHKFPSSHDQKWKLSGGDGFEGSGGSSSHKFPSGHEQKWKLPGGDNFGGFGGGLVGGSSSHKFPSSYGQKWKLTGGETVDGLGGGLDYNKPKHKSAMKKPTEQPSMFKKIIHILSTLLPLGLFFAALPPTILNINTTQPTVQRLRSLDSNNPDQALIDLVKQYGLTSLDDSNCEDLVFCEMARLGGQTGANFVQKAFWQLAHEISDKDADAFGLRDVFKAARTSTCREIFTCQKGSSTKTPPPKKKKDESTSQETKQR